MTDAPRELLPCPFCGGTAELCYDDSMLRPMVSCCDCYASVYGELDQDAIAAWNRRTAASRRGEGWVLVPREPTPEMLAACDAALQARWKQFADGVKPGSDVRIDTWNAMLAAAPGAPHD